MKMLHWGKKPPLNTPSTAITMSLPRTYLSGSVDKVIVHSWKFL